MNQNPASASAKVLLKSTLFDKCGCSTISSGTLMIVPWGYSGTVRVPCAARVLGYYRVWRLVYGLGRDGTTVPMVL